MMSAGHCPVDSAGLKRLHRAGCAVGMADLAEPGNSIGTRGCIRPFGL